MKELRKLVKQMDGLLPTLSGKEAANLLIEKASVVKALINLETERLSREVERLTAENLALREKVSTPAVRPTRLTDVDIVLQAHAKQKEGNNAH